MTRPYCRSVSRALAREARRQRLPVWALLLSLQLDEDRRAHVLFARP